MQYLTGGLCSVERLDDDDESVKWAFLHSLLGVPEEEMAFCSCFLKVDTPTEQLQGLIPG